jgi:predicted ATPase
VAQIGAVIGRGFSCALIRAVAERGDAAPRRPLERLAEADILLVQALPPESDYRFKHALTQDAACAMGNRPNYVKTMHGASSWRGSKSNIY